ncbi:hypothetical protein IGI04_010325 [Brassica rapa subsp. trilocularis]|nr:hypothetical protein IGI04_010325 [Brassica rapa subsp. trilocularis]
MPPLTGLDDPGLVFAVGTKQIRIKPNQSFTILILTSNHQSEANESYQMGSDWRRSMGNVRSFVGNSMGGLRGGQNLASWLVAGTIAYYLWVKPAQDLKKEQQARALLAVADANEYVEKRKPIADPQVTGLIYGNKNRTDKQQD